MSGRINAKKAQLASGGGLLTSNPPPRPTQLLSNLASPSPNQASSIASTSAEKILSTQSVDSNRSLDERDEPEESASPKKRRVGAEGDGGIGKGKAPVKKRAPAKAKKPAFVPSMPFPEHFVKLEKTFKALNTVYTFCSTRKGMATTFDSLKGSVQNLLKRPLEIHDIAQIKSLLPSLVTFAYIDSELLRIHPTANDEAAARKAQRNKEKDEAYIINKPPETKGEVVLQFSFNDGELKSVNGVGKLLSKKASWKKKADPSKESTVPVPPETTPRFTIQGMTKLIEARNLKFSEAVSELLVACAAHQPPEDPVGLLLAATEDALPVKTSADNAKGLGEKRHDADFYRRFPEMRPTVEALLEEMKLGNEYKEQIVEGGHRIFEARDATYGTLNTNLSDRIWDALWETKKINQLYSHQALALNYLEEGKNVIVSTSTASGKSGIYQLALLRTLEQDMDSTALYIFPTKALAQDQKRGLDELLSVCEGMEDIKIATFDGDTPKEDRDYIRENASVVLANPDILHLTILPREESWRRFFRNLKFVVVDELHCYAGLFGCHVALVMRRIRRICVAVGNPDVQFISCSATIANPAQHMQTLFGIDDVVVIEEDGSPCGRKEYVVWNPPFVDERDLSQGRISTITEASRLFRFLIERGFRTIMFCKVRRVCEIMMKQVRADFMLEGRSDLASKIMSYRSGYSAADRRKIEKELFSGQLLGVISTTALELGVDIGSLDAVLTVGFPYHLPGLRQQAGRAGRRNKDSLAMLICDPYPLDQHYARNPSEIFDSPYTQLQIDLENPIVLEAHVQCAADEVPILPADDEVYFGPSLSEICESRLIGDSQGYFHTHPRLKPYPAKFVSIRATEDEGYSIIDVTDGRNEVIEEIETSRAIFTTYEGAVYLHQGVTFLVKEVNHDRKLATVQQATIDWQTRQRDFTNVDPGEVLAIREIRGSEVKANYGTVKVESVVFGYFKVDRRNNIIDTVDLNSPSYIRASHGLWIDVPPSVLRLLVDKNFLPAAAIHAAEHAMLSLTPMIAMSAEGDVKTECKQPEKELAKRDSTRKRAPRLIFYDAAGKSGGICAKAFDHISVLLEKALETISVCPCLEGCPSCVASHVCTGGNAIVSKLGAFLVLSAILNRPIDPATVPMQEVLVGIDGRSGIDLRAIRDGKWGMRRVDQAELMEVEEMDEEEREMREQALRDLIS